MKLDAIITELVSDNVTALVNLLQILGLYVTVYVYLGLRRLKGKLGYLGLAPEYERLLRESASRISDYLNNFQGSQTGLREEMTKIKVLLNGFRKQLSWCWWPWGDALSTNRVLRLTRVYESSATADHAYEIYLGIQTILLEIEDRKRNAPWRQT